MSLQAAGIAQNCKALRLTAVGAQFASLAEEAAQHNHSHLHYLEALLQTEIEDRERRSIELRMKEAHLPRIKTLEEFYLLNRLISRLRTATSKASMGSCGNVEVKVFFKPADARIKLHDWRRGYNLHRSHLALADRTPAEFAATCS